MRDNGSLRGRLLGNLALLLVVLMLASGLSAYWNGREAADTGLDEHMGGRPVERAEGLRHHHRVSLHHVAWHVGIARVGGI